MIDLVTCAIMILAGLKLADKGSKGSDGAVVGAMFCFVLALISYVVWRIGL